MAKKNSKTKSQETTQIYVTKDGRERFKELHKRARPQYKTQAFFDELLAHYEKSICPECGETIPFRRCSCKGPEVL